MHRRMPGRATIRILVVGQAGSGKTTTARKLAVVYGIPHCELDTIRHRVRRFDNSRTALELEVRRFCECSDWVIDGTLNKHQVVRRQIMGLADEIVYLDLSVRAIEFSVLKRHLRSRKWITMRFLRRRKKKIDHHQRRKERLEADLSHHAVKTVRLHSRREIDRYLSGLKVRATA